MAPFIINSYYVLAASSNTPPLTDDLLVYYNPDVEVFSDDIGTVAVDGDFIRQFNDQSGNSNTLTQVNASAQPLYDTTTFNDGLASVKSINDTLFLTNPLNLGGTTDWTFHMVYKKEDHADSYYWFKGEVAYPRMEHRKTILQVRADGSGSPRGVAYTDNTTAKIMTITNNMSTGEFKLYINGRFIGEASSSAYYANNPLSYTIAQLYANGTTIINTGNVLFYTAEQTSEEVTLMTDWLNDKYKLYNQPLPITDNLELYINPDEEVYSDDIGTLAVDGDNIRQISDHSDNGLVLDQSTASSQFVYAEDHFGTGLSAINSPTGSTQHMDFTSTITIPGATKSLTFYAVYDKTNTSGISYLFGTTDNNFNRILEYNNHSIYFQDTDGDTHFTSIANTTGLAIRAFTLDTSTDTITTYNNGVLDSSSTLSKTWGDFNFDSFWGGANVSYIGSTLLYSDAHDATQVVEISNWLNVKYNVY